MSSKNMSLKGWIKWNLLPTINKWPLKLRARSLMRGYHAIMGYSFDLNEPHLFTEKLQWYKLYYDRPDLDRVVDKYLFKGYIEEKLGKGYTIPLYGAWSSIEDFRRDWAKLPKEFVLKSTLQSDGKCIKIIRDKDAVDAETVFQEASEWLDPRNTLINSLCRAYFHTTPRILAEEYMEQVDNQLYDYKFFCFQGKPHCVYVATDHFPGQLSHISFYNLEWNRRDVRYGKHPNCDVAKPKLFDEMMKVSEKLSKDFPFVRVDFFEVEDRIYLSELTLYPGGGFNLYHPESFNKELGDLFVLPEKRGGK